MLNLYYMVSSSDGWDLYVLLIVSGAFPSASAVFINVALGVKCKARYILSVSCCQHTMHRKIKGHPLTAITRHGVFKEQLAHMTSHLSDSLALLKKNRRVCPLGKSAFVITVKSQQSSSFPLLSGCLYALFFLTSMLCNWE